MPGLLYGFGKPLFQVGKVPRCDGVLELFPVILQIFRGPVPVNIVPGKLVETIEVRKQHMLGDGLPNYLVAIIEGYPQLVRCDIWERLVNRERRKNKGIPDLIIGGMPFTLPFIFP